MWAAGGTIAIVRQSVIKFTLLAIAPHDIFDGCPLFYHVHVLVS
jgi:hypothetical protein